MHKKYILGTRGSLLALTQSNQIKDQLESISNLNFEIKVISTQGDENTERPLWQMDGKDFFTKELDTALIKKEIDLVVHSYKDLGSDRPTGINLAAITKRSYSHDILLIKNETIEKLKEKKELIIGTSSPRRIYNIENFLSEYIPYGENFVIKTKNLRGNINTRIEKLQNDEYDGIVLALAGLERLAITASSKVQLEKLLQSLNYMILPQSTFPSAASQGALAIECNENTDKELLEVITKLNDLDTIEEVKIERQEFQKYGGGCHLAVGINAKKIGNQIILSTKGISDEVKVNERSIINNQNDIKYKSSQVFIGMPQAKISEPSEFIYDELIEKKSIQMKLNLKYNVLVSSNYAIPMLQENSKVKTTWSSGMRTHRELVKNGFWCNGSADSLGESELNIFRNSSAINIMTDLSHWSILTNLESKSEIGEIVESYQRFYRESTLDYQNKLKLVEVFFWTSYNQYKYFSDKFPFIKDKKHTCGLGKTKSLFMTSNIDVTSFTSVIEFKNKIIED